MSKKEEWYFEVTKNDKNFYLGTKLPNGRSFVKYESF